MAIKNGHKNPKEKNFNITCDGFLTLIGYAILQFLNLTVDCPYCQ